jgi:flavin reductase (DIM6/NTAB) family NADH-FMN oxidoreductase RutF
VSPLVLTSAADDDLRRRVLWAVPTVLAVLGTVDEADGPHLMNISWVTPVANDPTRLVVSIEASAKSASNLRATAVWALSLLSGEQRELGRAFVKPDLRYRVDAGVEYLHDAPVTRSTHRAPVLASAVAAMAGGATPLRALGSHDLFLLDVDEVGAVDELLAGPASAHAIDVLRVQETRMNYGK